MKNRVTYRKMCTCIYPSKMRWDDAQQMKPIYRSGGFGSLDILKMTWYIFYFESDMCFNILGDIWWFFFFIGLNGKIIININSTTVIIFVVVVVAFVVVVDVVVVVVVIVVVLVVEHWTVL